MIKLFIINIFNYFFIIYWFALYRYQKYKKEFKFIWTETDKCYAQIRCPRFIYDTWSI